MSIKSNLRIKTDFERPDKDLVEAFRNIPVANIADCMNRMSCMSSRLFPLNSTPLLGVAFTIKATGGDNLLFHKALDLAKPGDVIVVAGEGEMQRAFAGEIMARYAKSRGIVGFVVDGCMRDRDGLSVLDFPVYCTGITPNGPYKNGPGEMNYPVACAEQVVNPGDIIVGDADGVVVIRPDEAKDLAEKVKKVMAKEAQNFADIDAGRGLGDRSWIDKSLQALGYDIE